MIDPATFNLAQYVLSAGQVVPDKIALAVLGRTRAERWSYARLTERVQAVAGQLRKTGLQPGDRLLLRIGNEPAFPLAFLGAIAAGIVPVPTSAALTVPEITKIARELDPKAVVAAAGVACPETDCPVLATAALLESDAPGQPVWDLGAANRPAYIVFTSGTGGTPRGVVHAHRAILARRMMWEGWYGLTADDRLLHAGAFNWTYTLGTGLLDPWAIGATALIPDPSIDTTALPLLLKRHDVTIFAAAPGVYRQLLRSGPPILPKLRHGLSAGEKLPAVTRAKWESVTGTPIHEAYGMSECSTFISGSPSRPAPDGTLGHAQPGRRIAIRAQGAEVETGSPGMICIHRDDPGLMLGYLGHADETAARFDGEWFQTGDTGSMDATGAVTYLGRADDLINAGGLRVSPIEIEDALASHPSVAEAAACEVRVKADTTIIAAFWVGETLDEQVLLDHVSSRLADYKRPRVLIQVDSLPRGANNKLLRRKLRQDWEARNGHA